MSPSAEYDPLSRENAAARWCATINARPLLPDEQLAFDWWLVADPANVAAWSHVDAIWHGLANLGDFPETIAYRADALEALRRANRRRWAKPQNLIRLRWLVGTAAAVALFFIFSATLRGPVTPSIAAPVDYVTAIGERRTLAIADGSRLSLDADTRVAVKLEGERRALTLLSGRAKFDVAKDPRRPFTVTAGDKTVVATGTAFSVELLEGRVHVVVYEGRVVVIRGAVPPVAQLIRLKNAPGRNAVQLTPAHELVAASAGNDGAHVTSTDVARALSWEGGQLNFVDEPLASAVERLNRYSTQKVVIVGNGTGSLTVNGVFNARSSEDFAVAVAEAYHLSLRRETGRLILGSAATVRRGVSVM